MLLTTTLVQVTPAHIYKKFPPSHKVSAETKVPTVPAVEAKADTPPVQTETLQPVALAPVVVTPPTQPITACGSDPQMAYIYTVESGCRTGAYNELGCRGLGQACPGGKLPCSDSDWTCQDNWFRNYAVERYGSIYNAYVFRLNHNWW